MLQERFPIVKTTYGTVAGEIRDGVSIFRGIPYGDRCDRERRFSVPKEPESWFGIRDCTKNGAVCVQASETGCDFYSSGGHPDKLGLTYETQDENCLFLNVLTPGIDHKKRPVMFYTHGGGYAHGSGTHMLGADKLASEQDVVLVSVNHRLHIFGYLYLGDLDERFKDSGNVGNLDIILALQWVKDNIESFGGDPNCVTIIGESGGSDKVNTLLHMPEAQGLFHRAISISGSLPIGKLTRKKATEITLEILELLNISPNKLEKLFELPARYMTETVFAENSGIWAMTLMPVADGIHLPETFGDGWGPGEYTANVPVIFGASEDEMASFALEVSKGVTDINLKEAVLKHGREFDLDIDSTNADSLLEVFRKHNVKQDNAGHLLMKLASVGSYLCSGAFYQAQAYAAKGNTNIFLYLNRYDAPFIEGKAERYAGHCIDLAPAFRMVAYQDMEEYSKKIAAAYAAFMRTGNPSTESLLWLPFNNESRMTMVYDSDFYLESDPLKKERQAIEEVNGGRTLVNPFYGRKVSSIETLI